MGAGQDPAGRVGALGGIGALPEREGQGRPARFGRAADGPGAPGPARERLRASSHVESQGGRAGEVRHLLLAAQEVVAFAELVGAGGQERVLKRDAQALHEVFEGEEVLVGQRGADEEGQAFGPVVGDQRREFFSDAGGGFCGAELGGGPVRAEHRGAPHAGLGVGRLVAVAALVAHPPAVDFGVVAGLEAGDAAAVGVPGALGVRVDLDRTAARAAGADGGRAVQVPGAHREAEVLVGEGADGADVDDVARVGVVQAHPGIEVEDGAVAAAEHRQLVGLGDVVDEARAARALDAALLVEHDPGADVLALLLVALVLAHGGLVEPEALVVVLQVALAGLVADRAVQGVVGQVELEGGGLGALGDGGVGFDVEAFFDGRAAGHLGLGRAGHLADAQAAHAGVAQPGVVAVVGDLDALVFGGVDDELALRGLDVLAVELEGDQLLLSHGRPPRRRRVWRPSASRSRRGTS
ncbi:MAG: hypothetical protein FD126_961 [Elusimicrobia bacterium]|nr:MAG: hypothetical protein FD126_961 [Elusimicrobiota bacterium]